MSTEAKKTKKISHCFLKISSHLTLVGDENFHGDLHNPRNAQTAGLLRKTSRLEHPCGYSASRIKGSPQKRWAWFSTFQIVLLHFFISSSIKINCFTSPVGNTYFCVILDDLKGSSPSCMSQWPMCLQHDETRISGSGQKQLRKAVFITAEFNLFN